MIPFGRESNHPNVTRLRASGASFFVLAVALRTCGSRVDGDYLTVIPFGEVSNHLKTTRLRASGAGFFVLATILRTCEYSS